MNLQFTEFFDRAIQIGDRRIGPGQPVYIVAEAGVAHFGSVDRALELVDAAVAATADAIKFQVFRTEELISRDSPEWRSRLKPKELDFHHFRAIRDYCRKRSITFFATAHDEKSADFLQDLDVPAIKVGSGEVGNITFLGRLASQKKPLIISTGMHTLNQIRQALKACREAGNSGVAILHCVTAYPAPPSNINLKCIPALQHEFGIPVGYSDHTIGWTIPLAAVAVGACIVEKHICLDKSRTDSQDCLVSCDPTELVQFVSEIRRVEASLGSSDKKPQPAEEKALVWARKSAVPLGPLQKGMAIEPEHVRFKRPGTGISPEEAHDLWGKRLKRDVDADHVLQWTDFE